MTKKKDSLESFLSTILGGNPIIFLDTSAVIGIEEKRHIGDYDAMVLIDGLPKIFPVLITDEVFQEIINHYYYHIRWGGKREISDVVYNRIVSLNEDFKYYRDLINGVNFDDIRYRVYIIKEKINQEELKEEKSVVSDTDYRLVANAAWFSKSILNKEPISGVLVISQDKHIDLCVSKLKSMEYNLIVLPISAVYKKNNKKSRNLK